MNGSPRPLPRNPLETAAGESGSQPSPGTAGLAFHRFHPRDAADRLLLAQNPDGGWPYASGQSWTEATALAILALRSAASAQSAQHQAGPSESSQQLAAGTLSLATACHRGIRWLGRVQRPDGGFAPAAVVQESTWVTSLASLALISGDAGERESHQARWRQSLNWLLAQRPARAGGLIGVLARLLNSPKTYPQLGGAPWYPGTAAWVAPTAMRVFALAKAATLTGDSHTRRAVEEARSFLWAHRLTDGGWNHGGSYADFEQVASYPESTGMTLLALRGLAPELLLESIDLARKNLERPGSLEAWAWLRMSLHVHNQLPPPLESDAPGTLPVWTTRELALGILAWNASSPDNAFTGKTI